MKRTAPEKAIKKATATDLKTCSKYLSRKKLTKFSCLSESEFYEAVKVHH